MSGHKKSPGELRPPGAADKGLSTMRTKLLYHENICLTRGDYSGMGEIYRSLYSVIPARVRDDHTLRPNAKLLYGELSALAQAEGYCWAWNARLAETLGISKRTVEDLLRAAAGPGPHPNGGGAGPGQPGGAAPENLDLRPAWGFGAPSP